MDNKFDCLSYEEAIQLLYDYESIITNALRALQDRDDSIYSYIKNRYESENDSLNIDSY